MIFHDKSVVYFWFCGGVLRGGSRRRDRVALFFLEYDIRSTNHDYKPLNDVLAEFNAVRVLQSLWCFNRVNTTAKWLRMYFRQFIHANDSLCVSQVVDWSTWNALGTPNDL